MFNWLKKIKKQPHIYKVPLSEILDRGTKVGGRSPVYMDGKLAGSAEYKGDGEFLIQFSDQHSK